jgi:DNA polymerase III alpha subunit
VRVAGLVTTRQRPQTAKGFVFVLMEDEHGPINVIVKPDIYQRDRSAVRMEPFLAVRGKLQKDGATLNVIAHEVEALRVPGAPVQRRGLARTQAVAAAARERAAEEYAADARERAPDAPHQDTLDDTRDLGALPTALPDAQEYWAEPAEVAVATAHGATFAGASIGEEASASTASAFRYLTALRQSPPGIKNFG